MVTVAKSLSSNLKLNDGQEMPMFGLGMWSAASGPDGPAERSVVSALQKGYRLIDTATLYGLDCGYVDLYLIHSPSTGHVLDSYRAMVELQQQGLIRSIGVSNFGVHHLEAMKGAGVPTPAVNQIELHPWMKRHELVDYCRQNGIAVMGYSPLVKAQRMTDPTLVDVANKIKKTVAQTLIRYSVQMGYITIPMTDKEERLVENAQVFDWDVPEDEMALLNSLPEKSCTKNPALSPWNG